MITTWRDLGLPYPQVGGFSYKVALGVLSTPFPTEYPRRARVVTAAVKSFSLTFNVTEAQLKLAEGLLTSRGYRGFALRLTGGPCTLPVGLRLTDKYTVSALGYDYYSLVVEAEEVETCEIYAAVFDDLTFPDLTVYDFPVLSDLADAWGVLDAPWTLNGACPMVPSLPVYDFPFLSDLETAWGVLDSPWEDPADYLGC